jgi:hypothetical protein
MLIPKAHYSAKKLRRERTVWGRLRHPNVLPLYGFADDYELFQPLGALISPVSPRIDMVVVTLRLV